MDRRSSQTPAITIFRIGTRPEPKTMALGGVDTGNMNAQDAANVVGISSNSGWASMAWARLAMMGTAREMVAVLEETSVRPVMNATVLMTMTSGLASPSIDCSWLAIKSDNPDVPKPLAMASPPPKISSIPQGSFFMSSQSSNLPPTALLAGMINSVNAMAMDTVLSSIM